MLIVFYNLQMSFLILLQTIWAKIFASVFMRLMGQKSCTAMAFSDFVSSLIIAKQKLFGSFHHDQND